MNSYSVTCPKDGKVNLVEKSIEGAPKYGCFTLDYNEDLARGFIKPEDLPNITIEEQFEEKNMVFSLVGIIYFQGMHYTSHVKGIQHPKLFPLFSPKWYYHDGFKDSSYLGKLTKGLLFENVPNFIINLMKDELKPYILIYRINSIE